MTKLVVTPHAVERLQERLHVVPQTAGRVAEKAWAKGAENTGKAIVRRNRTAYFVSPKHIVKELMGRAFVFDPRSNDGSVRLVTVI